MRIGHSPEEAELAGEELSGFFTNLLKKIGGRTAKVTEAISSVPGGKALMTVVPFGTPLLLATESAKGLKKVKAAVSGIGADSPLTDTDIANLIERETNPAKKYRMVLNFERARLGR